MGTEIDKELLDATLERVVAMEALAERILAECRVQLMVSFRFLDRALWNMPFRSMRLLDSKANAIVGPRTALACDGRVLYYNAKAVIGTFRANPDAMVRAYLHVLLHCIFRHPFHTVRANVEAWSLACDICVEAIALEMCDGRFALEGDDAVMRLVARVSEHCRGLTPAKVYRMLLVGKRDDADAHALRFVAELEGARDAFARDIHQLWDLVNPPKVEDGQSPPSAGAGDDGRPRADEASSEPENPQGAQSGDVPKGDGGQSEAESDESTQAAEDGGAREGEGRCEDGSSQLPQPTADPILPDDALNPPRQSPMQTAGAGAAYSEGDQLECAQAAEEDDAEQTWEDIAKQVETELRTMGKERGEGAGTFTDNLSLANRSRVDYAEFLRRFSTRAEDASLNDEEFDYIFYTYGLALYENMPLVEPLEYKEAERVREFVIAIDTSGSCSRGLVQAFLTRTCEILGTSGRFDEQVNVHIVQCDAEVQSVEVIRDAAEFAAYRREFEVHGYGGTDFRPVFAYVDELLARHEFTDLRGLVYFTDGYGTFPTKAPAYDVAFVFVEDEGKERRVPPWAMKVVLDGDTLYETCEMREVGPRRLPTATNRDRHTRPERI